MFYESRNFLCFVLITVRVSGFISSKHDSKHYTICEHCTIVKKVFRNGIISRFILVDLIADGRIAIDRNFLWTVSTVLD